jgi:mannitol 2-dehydrogenase
MVDRITPRTTHADREIVAREFGVADQALVVSEPFRQWVLEDTFAMGRPAWELVGVQLTSDVAPYEAMKMRLLNGGHSSVAYCAALLGFEYVAEALADPALRQLLLAFLAEVRPAVRPLPGINLEVYAATIVERFANPRMRDQIPRICSNGCAKIAKFIVPSMRDLLATGASLQVVPLVIASWLRYISGADDRGHPIDIADPALGSLNAFLRSGHGHASLALSVRSLFGDLAENYPAFVESVQRSLNDFRNFGARQAIERTLIHNPVGRK